MHTKKLFYIALFFLTASGFAQDKIKITNTFGADKDSISSRDFLDVNHFSYFEYDVADRIHFDYSSDLFTARLRTTINPYDIEGYYSNITFKGYALFTPVKYFNLAIGNSFFNKFALDSFYFASFDDYPGHGKLLNDGIGILSKIDFNDFSSFPLKIKIALGVDTDSNYKWKQFGFNTGLNFNYSDFVNLSFTFKNIWSDKPFKFAGGLGLNFSQDIHINLGYVYNNTDKDFLLYSTKDSVFVNVYYAFKDIPLTLAFDVVSGLNDYFISDYKLTESQAFIPFTLGADVKYKYESWTFNCSAKLFKALKNDALGILEVKPGVKYKFNKNNSIETGLRITLKKDYKNADGIMIPNLSIPFTWKFNYEL